MRNLCDLCMAGRVVHSTPAEYRITIQADPEAIPIVVHACADHAAPISVRNDVTKLERRKLSRREQALVDAARSCPPGKAGARLPGP